MPWRAVAKRLLAQDLLQIFVADQSRAVEVEEVEELLTRTHRNFRTWKT